MPLVRRLAISPYNRHLGAVLNSFTPTGNYVAIYNAFTTKPTIEIATKQQTLIDSLVIAGVWDKLDVFYLLGGHTNGAGESLINWITPGTHNAELVNAPTFEANYGFTGNGLSSYIRTNYNPFTDGVNYTQNSASGGVLINNNIAENTVIMGATKDASAYDAGFQIMPRYSTNYVLAFINCVEWPGSNISLANLDSRGFFVLNRTASNYMEIRKAGVSSSSSAKVSTALYNSEIYILANHSASGANYFSTNQVRFAYLGGGLTAQEIADFNTALQTFFFSINMISDIDTIVGESINIYNDSLTDVKIGESVSASYVSDFGSDVSGGYMINPSASGTKNFNLKINTATQKLDLNTNIMAYDKSTLGTIKILDVGDSLVYQGQKTRQQIVDTLPGVTVQFLGSQTDGEFLHEGVSGWQYLQFASNISPFWNGSSINPTNYFTANGVPDIVHMRCGVNEAFSASVNSYGFSFDDLEYINVFIEKLVTAFLLYNETIKVIIGIPTVCENVGTGWNANYDESTYIQNNYIKAINQLRSYIVNRYGNKRFNQRLYICAEGYTVDRGDNISNGVHLAEGGYRQLGKSLAATINAILRGK